jgi:hypothetical protein
MMKGEILPNIVKVRSLEELSPQERAEIAWQVFYNWQTSLATTPSQADDLFQGRIIIRVWRPGETVVVEG